VSLLKTPGCIYLKEAFIKSRFVEAKTLASNR